MNLHPGERDGGGAAAVGDEHVVAVDEFLRVLVDGHRDDGAAPAGGGPGGSLDGRPVAAGSLDGRLAAAAAALRVTARREGVLTTRRLRQIARLAELAEAAARRELARRPRVSGQPDDTSVLDAAVTGELQAALGVSAGQAGAQLELARRLTRVLPATLAALADGRLDLPRARALAQATTGCPDPTARRVEALLLPAAGAGPWDAPSPRAWRARLERAVTAADPAAAHRRHQQALADRALRTWP
ncbi:MAG: DUF222 domain-containing protein, partial [Actinomycetes bacterium]